MTTKNAEPVCGGRPNLVAMFAAGLLALGFAEVAKADSRTVCFQLKIRDERYNCPNTSGNGVRRRCATAAEDYSYAVGHVFEVWDRDSGDGSDDDYIGRWHTTGEGEQCVTFEWEGASYSGGEAHPDVFLRYINLVGPGAAGSSEKLATIRQADNSPYGSVTWRNGTSSDGDAYTAVECRPGASCRIYPGGSLVPTASASSNYALALMALDTVQRVVQVFAGNMDDGRIVIEYPHNEPGCGGANCSTSRTNVFLLSGQGANGFTPAHEVGHAIQKQEFNQDDLQSDCSFGTSGWSPYDPEYDSCATVEGFATYVPAVTWWNPDNASSNPVFVGDSFESATLTDPVCSKNRGIPLQVAKSFWDLDDANNEAGVGAASGYNDTQNLTSTAIMNGWDLFPDGTGNRQDSESDRDGVNMRDYDFNVGVNDETFLQHNCVGGQTDT